MQSQSYSGRWLSETIREICRQQGITLRSLSDGWLLELEKNDKTTRILGFTFDINSAAASSIGRDKVATYELVKVHDIPVIPHWLVRLSDPAVNWNGFDWAAGIVVKPLTGMGGENVCLFYDAPTAKTFMQGKMIEAWALSPLAPITREIRVIMLDGKMLFTYGKQPVTLGGLKVFNLSKGAVPVPYTPTAEQVQLAKEVQKTLGLRLAAVDIVELAPGEWRVLEVNSTITMKKYAEYSEQNQKDARRVYAAIIEAMFL